MRKSEYFKPPREIQIMNNASMIPGMLYKQNRDWTCALACIRSITHDICYIGDEDKLIEEYKLEPGPLYSKDIVKLGILDDYHIVTPADYQYGYDAELLYNLLMLNYYVMVETMICYDHWLVLCGYIANDNTSVEKQYLLLYDPYYDNLRQMSVDEFESV